MSQAGNRHAAVAAVPFSSIFYCSYPLAAALTKRRVRIFYFFLSFTHITVFFELAMLLYKSPKTSIKSQHFRFTVLNRPNTSNQLHLNSDISMGMGGLNSSEGCESQLETIAVTLDGAVIREPSYVKVSGASIYLSFKTTVAWNGWLLTQRVENSSRQQMASRFSLHAQDGNEWRQVGSSSFIQINSITIFMNGEYRPKPGLPTMFHVESHKFYGFLLARLCAGLCQFAMASFSSLGRFRLAALMHHVFSVSFIACQLAEASRPPYPGDLTAFAILFIAGIETGALLLSLRGQWVYVFIWYGLCWLSFAAAVHPYGPEGRRCAAILGAIGAPFALIGAATKLSQRRTRAAARRAIEADRQHYDRLWHGLLADPRARAALAALAAAAAACPAASRPRQDLPHRPAGRLQALVRREEGWILADLAHLYAAAAAADPLLRAAVLGLARRSGGLLPAAGGGGGGQDDGYVRVAAWTVMGDVAWAELKRPARALEKVGGVLSQSLT